MLRDEFMLSDEESANDGGFVSLMLDGEAEKLNFKDGDVLPVLPLRKMVIFPEILIPVSIGRKKSLDLVREAYNKKSEIFAVVQKDNSVEDPTFSDLHQMGVVAQIVKILEMPDSSVTIIVKGHRRAKIMEEASVDPYLMAKIEFADEQKPKDDDSIFNALYESVKELATKIVRASNNMPDEAAFAIKNIEDSAALINFVCTNFNFTVTDKIRLLEIDDLTERGFQLLELLTKENKLQEIKASIQSKASKEIAQHQREYYLQQQMRTIQEELGGNVGEEEIKNLKQKALEKKWDTKTNEAFQKELKRLERTNAQSPDYSVQLNYLDTFVSLPWNEYSKDSFDIKKARKILDRDHYGMEKVKERIIEHISVLKLKGDMKSPIICLYGPPGVGKTSLGKSIAESLKRKYVRVSLGGLHDEAEIRGHRRTYIGAMPGRILFNINKAGTSNPVFILDEIDKVNKDHRGDPSSALLEVLDPEQNDAFHDNYLDVDYDLSKVLFVATANNVSSIPQPLLDRMELIEVSGYLLEEKCEIALRHLVTRQLANHGLKKDDVKISKSVMIDIIESYTRESGVRELDRIIAKLMRKIATIKASEDEYNVNITAEDVKKYLGVSRYTKDKYQDSGVEGIVTGLAWTSVGGDILYIESTVNSTKGGKLTLTGNLGDVMKESAMLALEYLKSNYNKYGIDEKFFEEHSFHIHVPEGAIPKDGPSAGITMLTALTSSIVNKKVKKAIAMTGEITLRGKVLPVGGIKEKILAAKRAGIKEIILCVDNRKDIDEIDDKYLSGLTFHFVHEMSEVLALALVN